MPRKRYRPEEIIAKLRQAEVLIGEGKKMPEVTKALGVHEVTPRDGATGPRVLVVVAHPDDEVAFAATLYKTTTALNGVEMTVNGRPPAAGRPASGWTA